AGGAGGSTGGSVCRSRGALRVSHRPAAPRGGFGACSGGCKAGAGPAAASRGVGGRSDGAIQGDRSCPIEESGRSPCDRRTALRRAGTRGGGAVVDQQLVMDPICTTSKSPPCTLCCRS